MTDELSVPDFVSFFNENESKNPSAYEQSYGRLRRWVEDSLDLFKAELNRVLFPIFVHAYLDLISKGLHDQAKTFYTNYKQDHLEQHSVDVTRIGSITQESQIRENDLAQLFLKNRYNLVLSRICFDLLLSFLQDNKFMMLTRLINERLAIRVETDRPAVAMDECIGITGLTPSEHSEMNNQSILLGHLPPDPWLATELERAINEDSKESYDAKADLLKRIKREPNPDSPSRASVPLPYPKFVDVTKSVEDLKALRNAVKLGGPGLPSICCYTFHNTYNTMTCADVSNDSTVISTGFSESFIRVFDLTGKNFKALGAHSDAVNQSHIRLVGHSGPVYGMSLSPDTRYLVSGSEDRTIRLWSLATMANVVVYKGHNFPVWDVQFSPLGYYFASASHDRTAKLWSTDAINPLRIFIGHQSDVDCVRFHPNGNYIATGSSDSTVRLFNVQKGSCVRLFKSHVAAVSTLAFSPDGQYLASSGDDGVIKLWDLGSGKLVKNMVGHTSTVNSLGFSRCGNQLASGGADCCVRIWDVKSSSENPEIKRDITVTQGRDGSITPTASFPTKRTPVFNVSYSRSNVILAAGPFIPPM